MKTRMIKKVTLMMIMSMLLVMAMGITAFAKESKKVTANDTEDVVLYSADEAEAETADSDSTGSKAMAAAIVVGLAAAAGAVGMGIAIAKSSEGISRQPEAAGNIRTSLMLGLVFIETAIIYALIVAILIIFVM